MRAGAGRGPEAARGDGTSGDSRHARHIPRQAALDPQDRAGAGPPRPTLAQRAAREAGRYLGFATYLLVIFGTLILFSVNIYARADQDVPHFPSYHFYALGLINALVLAKFMLIAEAAKLGSLTVGRRLGEGPLVYAILYRSLLFTAVLMAAYVLEELLVGAWHGRRRAPSCPRWRAARAASPPSPG